jgi:hypothetical protein
MINVAGCVDMILTIINELESQTVATIVMVLWTIWWRCNKKCWNDQIPHVFYVLRRARDALQDWNHMQIKRNNMHINAATTTSFVWTKHVNGTIKCNIDTSYYVEQNVYCVGACIRDSGGRFV